MCGVRVEYVEDPLMQKIRYLDKLVDELARGKAIERSSAAAETREMPRLYRNRANPRSALCHVAPFSTAIAAW